MKTKNLKTTMAILLALLCAFDSGTTALAAGEEWGLIPDDYILSIPSPNSTFRVEKAAPAPHNREESPVHEGNSDSQKEQLTPSPEEISVDIPKEETTGYTLEDFATVHLAEINRIREENGLSPMATDPTLTEMAQKRVEEYQTGHKRPDGSRWSTIFREYDTTLKAVGENWVGPWDDPYAQMELFMGSEGHKANILQEKARYVGIGVMLHEDGSGVSVLQLYAK